MTPRDDEGSALVDLLVWLVLVAMMLPVLVAVARSPGNAARVVYAVRAAAEGAAKERDPDAARSAAAVALDQNLLSAGNPRVCAQHSAVVEADALRPRVGEDGPPTPGHVEVTLRCVVDGRLLTGLPFEVQAVVVVSGRHVADVYRRAE
ncbi:MAG: hypothetical protein QOK43_1848 [Acidimicrobiaceae bacterium]|nr:hypothetical protein [Acidimicrobiaceae bacterium]